MLNHLYLQDILNQKEYNSIDSYLVTNNKNEPYDKDGLIKLVMWLDYDQFTWNEYAVERMTFFLNKYPNDLEIKILYFYFSVKIGLWKNVEYILKEIDVYQNSQYKDIFLYFHIWKILREHEYDTSYFLDLNFKKTLDDIGIVHMNFVHVHFILIQFYHFHKQWKLALNELNIANTQSGMASKVLYPILDFNLWIDISIRGNYSNFFTTEGVSNLKSLILNQIDYKIDFYKKVKSV